MIDQSKMVQNQLYHLRIVFSGINVLLWGSIQYLYMGMRVFQFEGRRGGVGWSESEGRDGGREGGLPAFAVEVEPTLIF